MRVESKAVPKNMSLADLLKPRNVVLKPENQKKWEEQREAKEYMSRMYGEGHDEGSPSLALINPPAIQEVLDLALKNLSVEMPEIIPFHKISYRFDLDCDNNRDDVPIRLISDTSIVQSAKPRVMNEEEQSILRSILDLLESRERKESAVSRATTSHKSLIVKAAVRQDDSDSGSDIFEDAGTDYVLQPRAKSAQESTRHADMKYFKDEEDQAKPETDNLDLGESKLQDLLEASREMNKTVVGGGKNNDGENRKAGRPDKSDDDEDENSMHMLEDVIADDGVNYDYAFDYSDDEDDGKEKLKVTVQNEGANKLNQEFQQMNKVYEKKFGQSLQKEGGGSGESKRKNAVGEAGKKRQRKG